jgi:hypothetical protein
MHRLTRVFANLTFYATIVCSFISIILIILGLLGDYSEEAQRNGSVDDAVLIILTLTISMAFVCFITSLLFHVRLIAFKED